MAQKTHGPQKQGVKRKRQKKHTQTYNDPKHGNPHGQPPPRLLAKDETQNTSRKTAQVVYRHDDALEPGRRVAECVEEVGVAYYAGEDALEVVGWVSE